MSERSEKRAFISSTSIDLPEHRKQVTEACLRMGYYPVGMEQWPAEDAGNSPAATDAATRAFRLAWCDGPPYAYHWGLTAARAQLQALAAPEPELPPFDPAAHEPVPDIEIDP